MFSKSNMANESMLFTVLLANLVASLLPIDNFYFFSSKPMLSCSQFSNAPIGNAPNFEVASLSSMRHTMSLSIFDRVSVDSSKGC